jgi:hypothetical protein
LFVSLFSVLQQYAMQMTKAAHPKLTRQPAAPVAASAQLQVLLQEQQQLQKSSRLKDEGSE